MKKEFELRSVNLVIVGIALFPGISLTNADQAESHYAGSVGIISVKNTLSADSPAILMLLESGYVAPVLLDGETASVSSVYFTTTGCTGDGFVEYTPENMFVMPGSVFKALQDRLYFIPPTSMPVNKEARSVRHLDTSFTVCESVTETKDLFLIRENDLSLTQWEERGDPPLSALRSAGAPHSNNTASSGHRPFAEESGIPDEFSADEICSADCLEDQIGDGICQKACFVKECSYDQGDCDAQGYKKPVAENECAAECAYDEINDGICDPACSVAACDFDGEDCSIEKTGNSGSKGGGFGGIFNKPERE